MTFQFPPQSESRSVLVVEDDRIWQSALSRALGSGGFRVETVTSVPQALKALAERRFDLIISDLHMPRVDGLELRDAVTGDARLSRIPFVFLSGAIDSSEKELAKQMGVDYCLEKPTIDLDHLTTLAAELTRFPTP